MADVPQYLRRPPPSGSDILAQLAGLQDEEDLADQQLQQAIALRSQPLGEHHGFWGGLAGGLQNAISQITGAFEQKGAEAKRRELSGKMSEGRRQLFDFLSQQPIAPAQQTSIPIGPFTFGGGY